MAKERIKEVVANYRNTQTHLWNAMLVTMSGSLALLLSSAAFTTKVIAGIGFLFSFLIFYFYLNLDKIVKNLTKKLED